MTERAEMTNPVLVEVLRGDLVESRHRGACAIVDAAGAIRLSAGNIDQPVYPRSAIKPLQAVPFILSGAADTFGFDDGDIALACASHNGEPAHVARARGMLERCGFSESDLECGAHWPMGEAAARALAGEGATPGQAHNNCSGKHAAMLATARHMGETPTGYTHRDHPVQRRIAAAISEITGHDLTGTVPAIDGCSAPNWPVPLRSLAFGFARFASGEGLSDQTATGCRRIYDAVVSHPFEVAGSGRFCTRVMTALDGAVLAKTGAEGVYCAALPGLGLGLAVKCDDGAKRAAECITIHLLDRLGIIDAAAAKELGDILDVTLKSWRGAEAGRLRAVF